jgi:uncharacterized membrane protein YqjE
MSVESKPPTQTSEASVTQLVTQLAEQTSRLVRDEMKLATKELQATAKHAGVGAGLFSVAGVLAVLGLATLVATAVAALALVLPVWAAALIVAVVLLAVAGIAALIGKKQISQASPTPERTVESVKQDVREIKEAS